MMVVMGVQIQLEIMSCLHIVVEPSSGGEHHFFFFIRKSGALPHLLYPRARQQMRTKLDMLGMDFDLAPTTKDPMMERW